MNYSSKRFFKNALILLLASVLCFAAGKEKQNVFLKQHVYKPPNIPLFSEALTIYPYQSTYADAVLQPDDGFTNTQIYSQHTFEGRNIFSATQNNYSPPQFCYDLTGIIFPNVVVSNPIGYGNPGANNFSDVQYIDDKNCNTATTCTSLDTTSMVYQVYYPQLSISAYAQNPLPAFVFFHSGDFSDCSHYNGALGVSFDYFCKRMAERGFVTFNVEYRRGVEKKFNYVTAQQQLASYRGCQDGRGALRSIIRRQQNHNLFALDTFQIDLEKLFVGGWSAGGVMMLNAAYYRNQQMVNAGYPVPAGNPTLEDVLGPIDDNYYYGGKTINYRKYIRGVMLGWCGTPLPVDSNDLQSQYNFFTNNADSPYDNPPLIAFHGAKDDVFPISRGDSPFNKQKVYFAKPSSNPNYNSESYCLTNTGPYKLDTIAGSADAISASPKNMYDVLHQLGRPCEMYIDSNMTHGLDKDDDTAISDFGTLAKNDDSIKLYMSQRTATFFQAILNNKTLSDLGNTLFNDCVNKRKKCNLPNSDCSNIPYSKTPKQDTPYSNTPNIINYFNRKKIYYETYT